MPDLPRRASGKKPGSRHNSFAPQPKPPEIEAQTSTPLPEAHETNPAQLAPKEPLTVEIVPQQPPPVAPSSAPANTAEPVDANEDSDDSESEESSNGSDSSSSDEEDPSLDDAEAGAAVEEINKAMTALKKLKHAHMLSPEEEKALKERAHKKWFQLKGQIKEKQKKDVTNILLKRKKNVFTVSSRIELLEEKSREIFAALKQFTNEMRDKTDRSAHEILRRRVGDIEHSLQSIDAKFASLPVPAPEKENDFSAEVDSLRSTLHLQLSSAEADATARHAYLEVTLANQRALIESMAQDFPVQLNTQAEDFTEKLKQIPDYSGAIESLKRSLRRKADLKLLKELPGAVLVVP
ncbi:hypothetical protein PHYBOEH_011677 [Phytophthora boehmeriae]|uniref:Uncharacterized protein n=1 Tax=Phytophthora boehmeriae TaxID=109152 RepID=A0A8T1WY22_9STRA|nr:hypothetical protein PHYBOEH_011677 [Phytophthora boehmeriae]